MFRKLHIAGLSIFLPMLVLVGLYSQRVNAACATLPTDKGTVTMSATVPVSGTYSIWSRNRTAVANNSGYYLQVDGSTSSCNLVGHSSLPVNTWTWVNYHDGQTSSRMTVDLGSGSHSFKLYGLDPSVQVDRLVLTTDAGCAPSGTGDNCVNSSVVGLGTNGSADQGGTNNSIYNRVYAATGKNRLPTDLIIGTFVALILAAFMVAAYLGWKRRIWERLPIVKNIHLKFLRVPVFMHRFKAKPSQPQVPAVGAQTMPTGVVAGSGAGNVASSRNPLRKYANHPRGKWLVVVLFALVGSASVLYGLAETPAFTLDPEKGAIAGVTISADGTAAGGSYIQFGMGQCPAGQTGTPPKCVATSTTTTPSKTGTTPSIPTKSGGTNSTTVNCPLTHAAQSCWVANTGVQNGTGFTPAQIRAGAAGFTHHVGDIMITTNGTTLDHMWIVGCVGVHANNVTIKNSFIESDHGCQVSGDAAHAVVDNGGNSYVASGTLFQNISVDLLNADWDSIGIGSAGYTCDHCQVYNGVHNWWAGNNVVIKESLGYNLLSPDPPRTPGDPGSCRHTETIDADSASYITVDHTYLWANHTDGNTCTTAAFMNGGSWGPPSHITVNNSYLEGFDAADMMSGCGGSYVVFTKNAFSNHNGYGGTQFYYGYNIAGTGNIFTGNYIPETGAAAPNPGNGGC